MQHPPAKVRKQLATLEAALSAPVEQGGVPDKAEHDGVTIATWNIRALGGVQQRWIGDPKGEPKRDLRSLRSIAAILERFDVIAIQELKTKTAALRDILRWLNRDRPSQWRIVVSDVTEGSDGNDERLGYLFDSSRIDLDGLVGEIVIPPDEVDLAEPRLQRQFARTPYSVSFRSVRHTSVAFIMITVHLNWGKEELRQYEAGRLAEWIKRWAAEPHVWDPDILTLGDFNIDRITNPIYKPFAELLTIPEKMHEFPRTIFKAGQDKHYDQIAWYENPAAGGFSLGFEDCGYFDIEAALAPAYDLPQISFSARVSDHYPMWSRFSAPV